MVFSSLFFLYIFLPLCLLLYFIQRSLTAKNIVLLCASLVFYAWGEPVYVLLMLAVAALNWGFSLAFEKEEPGAAGAVRGAEPAGADRIQIRGLSGGELQCDFQNRVCRAADIASDRHLVLHVSGAVVFGRRVPQRRCGAAVLLEAAAVCFDVSAAHRRTDCPLCGRCGADRRAQSWTARTSSAA